VDASHGLAHCFSFLAFVNLPLVDLGERQGRENSSGTFRNQPAAFKNLSASAAKHLKCDSYRIFAYPTAGRRQKIFG
jgi:hypothetical protein